MEQTKETYRDKFFDIDRKAVEGVFLDLGYRPDIAWDRSWVEMTTPLHKFGDRDSAEGNGISRNGEFPRAGKNFCPVCQKYTRSTIGHLGLDGQFCEEKI